jgi:hypothetical protein
MLTEKRLATFGETETASTIIRNLVPLSSFLDCIPEIDSETLRNACGGMTEPEYPRDLTVDPEQ